MFQNRTRRKQPPVYVVITSEQLDKIPEYQRKWLDIAQQGVTTDFASLQSAVHQAYRSIGLAPPEVRRFASPVQLHHAFQSGQERHHWQEALLRSSLVRKGDGIVAFGLILLLLDPFIILSWVGVTLLSWWWFGNLQLWLYLIGVVMTWGLLRLLLQWIQPKIAERWRSHLEQQIQASLPPNYRKLQNAFNSDSLTLWSSLGKTIVCATPTGEVSEQFQKCTDIWSWVIWCSWADFCITELGCECDRRLWQSIQTIVQSCSTVLPRSHYCYISDRPVKLQLDAQRQIHATGEPAVRFADDSHLYFVRGVLLKPEYGHLHPQQWQSAWVVSETNAEVRRILIEEIGYDRLCQELHPHVIDTWQEYTLLWLELPGSSNDPIFLLKMINPSTHQLHLQRVPPHFGSARLAAEWMNQNINSD